MSRSPWSLRPALRRSTPIALVLLAVGLAPSAANAESYTLDGRAADEQQATERAAICAAAADAHGVIACFSSEDAYLRSQAATVRKGDVPAGWAALPDGQDPEALAASYERELAGGGTVAPTAVTSCQYTDTRIWTSANKGGTAGSQGYTGVNVWLNYSSTYNNHVSSFNTTDGVWSTRWHDLADGGGAYYGPIGRCQYESNLASVTMGDGGTANDRFSSFAGW